MSARKLQAERLKVVVTIKTDSGETVEAQMPDREVAAVLPRSILLGSGAAAHPSLVDTMAPILARMTEGRRVRIWQYKERWFFSFQPWRGVRFRTTAASQPRYCLMTLVVPRVHENAECHGHVQGPLRPGKRDGHSSRAPRRQLPALRGSGPAPRTPPGQYRRGGKRNSSSAVPPSSRAKTSFFPRRESSSATSQGRTPAAPMAVFAALGWVGERVRGERKMRSAPNASAVRKIDPTLNGDRTSSR